MTQTKEDRKRAAWETVGKEREKAAATIATLQQERDDLRRVLEQNITMRAVYHAQLRDALRGYNLDGIKEWLKDTEELELAATTPREPRERDRRDRQAGAEVDETRYWMNDDTGRVIATEDRPGRLWSEIEYDTYDAIVRPGAKSAPSSK